MSDMPGFDRFDDFEDFLSKFEITEFECYRQFSGGLESQKKTFPDQEMYMFSICGAQGGGPGRVQVIILDK